jgi:hypothetical protein
MNMVDTTVRTLKALRDRAVEHERRAAEASWARSEASSAQEKVLKTKEAEETAAAERCWSEFDSLLDGLADLARLAFPKPATP